MSRIAGAGDGIAVGKRCGGSPRRKNLLYGELMDGFWSPPPSMLYLLIASLNAFLF